MPGLLRQDSLQAGRPQKIWQEATAMTNVKNSHPHVQFTEVARLIAASRGKAMQAVNTALIDLYWQVGAYISRKLAFAEWAME